MGKYTIGQNGVVLVLHRISSGTCLILSHLNEIAYNVSEDLLNKKNELPNLWFAEPGNPNLLPVRLVEMGDWGGVITYELQWGTGDSLGTITL